MLDIQSKRSHRTCDGMSRRSMLRVGAVSAMGLAMAEAMARKAHGQEAPAGTKAKSVIQLWMSGGPSHLDTFDPKPEAPEDYRGTLKAIDTNVPGIQICELLPQLAKLADKYSILRGFTHPSPAHEVATHIVGTGNVLAGGLVYPTMGSVVAMEQYNGGYEKELPPEWHWNFPNSLSVNGFCRQSDVL